MFQMCDKKRKKKLLLTVFVIIQLFHTNKKNDTLYQKNDS